jgi:hypothetical protein
MGQGVNVQSHGRRPEAGGSTGEATGNTRKAGRRSHAWHPGHAGETGRRSSVGHRASSHGGRGDAYKSNSKAIATTERVSHEKTSADTLS